MSNSPAVELSGEQKTMIQEVFHLFDTDGQGQLEEKELAGAIFAMGFSTNNHHKMAKNLISKYNGSLSLDQFAELMAGQLAGQDPEEKIKNTFAALCGNYPKVKTISLKLLKTKVKELHIKLTDMELESMIKDVASPETGEVGWEEYLQILSNSTWVWYLHQKILVAVTVQISSLQVYRELLCSAALNEEVR